MELSKDEIIRMARESGFIPNGQTERAWIERFAALVAEPWIKTNKALANEIIELKKQVDISALPIFIEAAVKEAVLVERELCAQVCDEYANKCVETENWEAEDVSLHCAAAIRARSNHG